MRSRVTRRVARIAVVTYAALLILGAWPWKNVPLLGPASRTAWQALERLSVRPGMAVFTNPKGSDEKLKARCQRVAARRDDGSREVLYRPECPPLGLELGRDPLDVVMQRMTRAAPATRLLQGEASRSLERLAVRRYVAIGDYFCRSPHAGSGDYQEVTLTEQRISVSYRRGHRIVSDPLVCTWACRQEPVPLPQCEVSAADDPNVAIVGPAAR